MPLCVESVSGVLTLPATQPADISACSMIVLTGGEFSQINVLAQQQIAPYNAIDGAQIFTAMFVSTVSMYLVSRGFAEIVKQAKKAGRL